MSRITLLPGNSHNITNVVSGFALFPRLSINVLRLILRIHDRLVVIKPVIPRHQIADADSQQEKRHSMVPKQLKCNEHRCHRTVGHTAEYRHHPHCCTQRWRNSQNVPKQAAKGGSHEKRRYDLTTLKAGLQSQCSKDDLPHKGERLYVPTDRPLDHRYTGSHVTSVCKRIVNRMIASEDTTILMYGFFSFLR